MKKQFVKRYSMFIEKDLKQDAYIAQVTHHNDAGSHTIKHRDILHPQ